MPGCCAHSFLGTVARVQEPWERSPVPLRSCGRARRRWNKRLFMGRCQQPITMRTRRSEGLDAPRTLTSTLPLITEAGAGEHSFWGPENGFSSVGTPSLSQAAGTLLLLSTPSHCLHVSSHPQRSQVGQEDSQTTDPGWDPYGNLWEEYYAQEVLAKAKWEWCTQRLCRYLGSRNAHQRHACAKSPWGWQVLFPACLHNHH